MTNVISMKALLESGVHFGHRTNKWHPAMKPYIFTERNGIHIIDLQQTAKSLNTAYAVVRDIVQSGENIMFIGTKRQAQETIKEEAMRCGMPYVTERWLGGMLTNWSTIYQRIMERWLSRRRIVLENVIELGNTETVKSCVAGDLGIALLPRFAVERQLADGTLQAVESDFP